MKFIKWFQDLSIKDIEIVGGKNAALGEMIVNLTDKGIRIPNGFAITSQAYWYFIEENKILNELKLLIQKLTNLNDSNLLKNISQQIRNLIESKAIPKDLELEIIEAYKNLCAQYKQGNCDIAVRSSATAEDLPTASFAGQQESFLNVKGSNQLLESYKKCLSSLFTQRAIIYRIDKGFDHFKVAISVGVQKMVRSDLASAGVLFTLDTETGFKDIVFINSSYGLGESVVQGIVNPDSVYVHKPTLEKGFKPILKKEIGKKQIKMIYSDNPAKPVIKIDVPQQLQNKFSLTDDEILELAKMSLIIEKYYSEINKKWTPMDIEWAKDGLDNQLYIVQSRYETIHAHNKSNIFTRYFLKESDESELKKLLIITGQSIGQKIVSGTTKVIKNVEQIDQVQESDIIITTMTDPDWVPAMKKAAGIITNQGGRTCHAAIVSRELGIPAIVGTGNATELIKTGIEVTMDCSQGEIGKIYQGKIPFDIEKITISELKKLTVELMLNTGSPDQAFSQSFLPVDGVGLARTEFIIANNIKIHPMALIKFDKVTDPEIKKQIEELTYSYNDKSKFFIDKLAQEAGIIAAAFYPKPVIIRLSDFKSNEYRNLIGGIYFEPKEENPMIGLRGASRYYSDIYKDGFALECAAMKKIRDEMGLDNVKIMIPFVRTPEEAKKVLELMKNFGLEKGKNKLEIIMMCEVPSNVILIDEFSKYFDGFSIGSNDLTQLTLAVDRDSALLTQLFNEKDESVKRMLKMAIEGSKKYKKPIGICGQAPSDYPEIAKFLIDCGINSISLSPDTVIPFLSK